MASGVGWGYNFSNGVSNSRGVAILFSRGLDYKCVKKLIDVHGRYIVVHIIMEGIDYLLCNIYAPTQCHEIDQLSTLNQIIETFQEFETENYLVGGDFNEILDPKIDRKNSGAIQSKMGRNRTQILDFMEQCKITNVWRLSHPKTRRYSFHRASRIDYWLISEHLLNFVTDTNINVWTLSDHSRVTLDMAYSQEGRGPGLWKFNNTFTADPEYTNQLSKLIDEKKVEYENFDTINKWEMTKYEIRKFSIQYGKKHKKEAEKHEKE